MSTENKTSIILSDDLDYDLTLQSTLSKQDNNDLSLLFPPIAPDYFKDKPNALTRDGLDSKVNNALDAYKNLPIAPYLKKRDLSDPFGEHNYEGGNKEALEIGLRFNF